MCVCVGGGCLRRLESPKSAHSKTQPRQATGRRAVCEGGSGGRGTVGKRPRVQMSMVRVRARQPRKVLKVRYIHQERQSCVWTTELVCASRSAVVAAAGGAEREDGGKGAVCVPSDGERRNDCCNTVVSLTPARIARGSENLVGCRHHVGGGRGVGSGGLGGGRTVEGGGNAEERKAWAARGQCRSVWVSSRYACARV